MSVKWFPIAMALLLTGCLTLQPNAVPIVDSGQQAGTGRSGDGRSIEAPASRMQAGEVVVMVPPLQEDMPVQFLPDLPGGTGSTVPSGIPAGDQKNDLKLGGPVLALLETAGKQRASGDLDSAASSLERAQRIAPREPQVLYQLARVRLEQKEPAQAEQLARRGLSFAGGRPGLQADLWELIAQAREQQGDPEGAAHARKQVRVNA